MAECGPWQSCGGTPPSVPLEPWYIKAMTWVNGATNCFRTWRAQALVFQQQQQMGVYAHTHTLPPAPTLHQRLQRVVLGPTWAYGVALLLLANIVEMGSFYFGQSLEQTATLLSLDAAFAGAFTLEFLAKVVAKGGVAPYLACPTCAFEAFCTLCSIVEVVLNALHVQVPAASLALTNSYVLAINFFRCARCLRFILTARVWPPYLRILVKLYLALPEILGSLVLFVLTCMGFALSGKQLFGPVYPPTSTLFPNFQTLQVGLLAVFQIADGENWDQLLKKHLNELGSSTALYFVLTYFAGTVITLNLFISTLIEACLPLNLFNAFTEVQGGEGAAGSSPTVPSAPPTAQDRYDSPPPPSWSIVTVLRWCFGGREAVAAAAASAASPHNAQRRLQSFKTALTLKTSLSGSVTSITLTLNPPASELPPPGTTPPLPSPGDGTGDGSFSILVTSSGSIRVIPMNEHAQREWNDRALMRWGEEFVTWMHALFVTMDQWCSSRLRVVGDLKGALGGGGGRRKSMSSPNFPFEGDKLPKPSSSQGTFGIQGGGEVVGGGGEDPQNGAGSKGVSQSSTSTSTPSTSPPLSPFRAFFTAWSTSPLWLTLSLLAIVVASGLLAFQQPVLDYCNSPEVLGLRGISRPIGCDYTGVFFALDVVLAVFFTLELVCNVLARGVDGAFTPGSFFVTSKDKLDWWSLLDVVVVVGALGGLAAVRSPWFSTFRAGRCLRVLRLFARISSLRVTLSALMSSVQRSLEPVMLTLVLVVIAALMGMQVFSGNASFCNTDSLPFGNLPYIRPTTPREACAGNFSLRGDYCALLPTMAGELACRASPTEGAHTTTTRVWAPFVENFNTMGGALVTAFELLTGEDWPLFARVYMGAADSISPGTILPYSATAMVVAAYFVLIQIFLKHFCLGLFGGFVASTFFEDRLDILGIKDLPPAYRVWVNNVRLSLGAKAPMALHFVPSSAHTLSDSPLSRRQLQGGRAPVGWWWRGWWCVCGGGVCGRALDPTRRRLFLLLQHPMADPAIAILVSVNLLVLSGIATTNTPAVTQGIAAWSNAFTLFFLLESLLRMWALGLWQFWTRAWLAFDALASFACAATIPFSLATTPSDSPDAASRFDLTSSLYTFCRLLVFFRVFRVARLFPGIKSTLGVIAAVLPTVLSLVAVHALLVYALAIAAMNLFDGVRYGWLGFLDPQSVNFDTFWNAFVTSYRSTTGENFNGLMRELASAPPYCLPGVNCGSPFYSYTFFIVLYTLGHFYCMQLCAAVMMHIYTFTGERDPHTGLVMLSVDLREEFEREWGYLDPGGTNLLEKADVIMLLCRLRAPLGVCTAPSSSSSSSYSSASSWSWEEGVKARNSPSLSTRVAARTLLESLPLPPVRKLKKPTKSTKARYFSTTPSSFSPPSSSPSSFSSSSSLATLPLSPSRSSNRATYPSARVTSPASIHPLSPSSASSPSLATLATSKASAAAGFAVDDDTEYFQFHSLLYSLLAHANSFTLDAGSMTVRGNHESSTLSLRAIFMLKRAFARFKMRKAAMRAAAAAPGTSSRSFSSRPNLALGTPSTLSPSNSSNALSNDPSGSLPAQASKRTLLFPPEAYALPVGAFTEDTTTITTTTTTPSIQDICGVVTDSGRSLRTPLEAIVEEVVEGHGETHEESRAAVTLPVALEAACAPEGGVSGDAEPFMSTMDSGVDDILFPEPPLMPSPSPLGSDEEGGSGEQSGGAGGDGEYTSLPIQSGGGEGEEYGGEEDYKAPESVVESGDGGSAGGGSNGEEGAVALPMPPVSPPSNFPSTRSLSKGASAKAPPAKAPPAKPSTTASASGGAATGKGRASARTLGGGGGEASKPSPPPGGIPKSGGLPFRSKRNLGYAKM